MKNQIIINDEVHNFVQDKPKVDKCLECSLQSYCYDKFPDVFLCNLFFNDKIVNGHFELNK